MLVRWGVLILLPYGLVPLLTVIISTPTLLLWYLESHPNSFANIPEAVFFIGVLTGSVTALVTWTLGHRMSARIARDRRERLAAFLEDPLRG
jgi:hypothetical protein